LNYINFVKLTFCKGFFENGPRRGEHSQNQWFISSEATFSILPVLGVCFLEFLGPQSWGTKGGSAETPPGDYNTSKSPGLIGLTVLVKNSLSTTYLKTQCKNSMYSLFYYFIDQHPGCAWVRSYHVIGWPTFYIAILVRVGN
jgi:hypothetical protein